MAAEPGSLLLAWPGGSSGLVLPALWLKAPIPGLGGSDERGLVHRSAPGGLSGLCRGITLVHKQEGMAERGAVKDKNSDGK